MSFNRVGSWNRYKPSILGEKKQPVFGNTHLNLRTSLFYVTLYDLIMQVQVDHIGAFAVHFIFEFHFVCELMRFNTSNMYLSKHCTTPVTDGGSCRVPRKKHVSHS